MSVSDIFVVFVVASATSLLALTILFYTRNVSKFPAEGLSEPISALLTDAVLSDVTPTAAKALKIGPEAQDWTDLRRALAHRFAGLPSNLSDFPSGKHRFAPHRRDENIALIMDHSGSDTSVHLVRTEPLARVDAERVAHLEAEVATLGQILDASPHPSWQMEQSGTVSWYNAAYARLSAEIGVRDIDQAALFEAQDPLEDLPQQRRASLNRKSDGKTLWYDLFQQQIGQHIICHAVNIEAVIQAEIAQRNFVQTLAKTFAQLSIGLAIFDRNRQLALFNPALLDLTKLPAEFLSTRPDLLSFFDQLREHRMMPEPKSYTSWRQQIAKVIAAAADGRYQETWTLETGQTYRVSGRPHPDRAIAFLIEDISAEVMVTRNFRAELELGQSLIDSIPDPLAVFTNTGILSLSNKAYRQMFKVDPDSSFADFTISDAFRDWERAGIQNISDANIQDYVYAGGGRAARDCPLQMQDGTPWTCHLQPIAAGATAIRFSAKRAREAVVMPA